MEQNTKCGWKNNDTFFSEVNTTSPKKLQPTSWEEEDFSESFNLSASDVANHSSAKSSISASTGSSFKEGMKNSKFLYGGDANKKSSLLEASVSSGEPFIGLKLGKKAKSSCQSSTIPRCQVEGCDLDLSSAKEYHRKHRVCESHSKCPKVVVSGLERRFCQQCSRFHSLAEFDEKKRSCRRRLSDHNARRRKPQQETIQFDSTNLSSSFFGGGQQLSFQSSPAINSTWENSSISSTYSIAKMKTKKSEILDDMSHLPNAVNMSFNRPMPSSIEALDHGLKEATSPNVDALRALSLLSNNSWGLYEPSDLIRLDHSQPDNLFMVQPGLPQGSSPDYWQQSIDPANTQFQLFSRFYSNPMDEILKPM